MYVCELTNILGTARGHVSLSVRGKLRCVCFNHIYSEDLDIVSLLT